VNAINSETVPFMMKEPAPAPSYTPSHIGATLVLAVDIAAPETAEVPFLKMFPCAPLRR
jgi:hypothetical protein